MTAFLIILFAVGACMAAHGRNRSDVGTTTLGALFATVAISTAIVADLTGVTL